MPKIGDRYRDAAGRLFELLSYVDPYGAVPPYWRVRTITEVTGLDVQTGQPVTEERQGRESTVRSDRLQDAGQYQKEPAS